MVSINPALYFVQNENSTVFLYKQTWYTKHGKRILDITVALLVSVLVLTWLIPILGLFIRATSPGPVLFIQLRTGRNGRIFRCLKFRTMYYDTTLSFRQAIPNDPRVTRLGQFLRSTNLDEMPQFLNVLVGDMSLVGPRPHAVEHDSQYWSTLDKYPLRYAIRPGITGIAQVQGARGITDDTLKMRHRLRYDLLYIKRQSLWVDIKLCWLTLIPMVKGTIKA